jgi:uncharacterized protein
MDFSSIIARELGVQINQVNAVLSLLEEGGTVPFIARYRKERTGSLDEVAIGAIKDRKERLEELEKRRATILKSIDEQGKLTSELKKQIEQAQTLNVLEDLYLPYKPKRKTRASMAREKGLEPLADLLWQQSKENPEQMAAAYLNQEKGVEIVEDALQGARDILAERINEDAAIRQNIRKLFQQEAMITSRVIKGKEKEAEKYKDYFDWSEPIKKIPSHRLLAIRRGEKEMFLIVDIAPEEIDAQQ